MSEAGLGSVDYEVELQAHINGKHPASVHDFHSFRVTSLRAVEVVMKHYFRPGREDFRAAILKAMPKMLADRPQPSVRDQVLAILEGMTGKTWRRDTAEAMRLLSEP